MTKFFRDTIYCLINLYFYSKLAAQKEIFNLTFDYLLLIDSYTFPGKRGHQYGAPALDQPGKWNYLGDSEDSMHRGGKEKARPPSTPSYVSNSGQHFIIWIVLNFQSPGLIQVLLQLKQTFQSQRYTIFEYMNQISFITACAFPYFKKETYWLVNPEYVSVVWQRFIRTKVSNWLGLHPGALFPFEHAEVSTGEQVQNGGLGKERESCVSNLNHLYPDHKNKCPMYTYSHVSYTHIPLYCIW